eukprot:9475205-Pyramimonas_sp.AAC.1
MHGRERASRGESREGRSGELLGSLGGGAPLCRTLCHRRLDQPFLAALPASRPVQARADLR